MSIRRKILSFCFLIIATAAIAQNTEVQYLSGTGSDHTVNWQFYCTGGMNANKWTTIAVPSCWEQQGFGKYNYGFAKDSLRGKEKGLYKHQFTIPAAWKGKQINIVFEGVMTDADIKLNGKSAGPTHQGAFYAFKYDISKLVKYGKQNTLEVTVAKHSANESVNDAERRGDYWLFGGIFRPVWLEALPATHISELAIAAEANGTFNASFNISGNADYAKLIVRSTSGQVLGEAKTTDVSNAKTAHINAKFSNPAKWTSETPNLYTAEFTIYKNDQPLHTVSQKIGFRTVEVKQRDGIYVNGVKVKMKGVNRHSFRPETGRTLSKQNSIEDVLLIKDMNMNAVRMSHYPPDGHFLDVCDSLGLFVMDELAGWHGNYNDTTGAKLLKEMISHDVNHPSIIIWSNGNEGGHNFNLDKLFGEYDIQKRAVVHPWQNFGGFETQHYRQYNYGIGNFENGREIVMPTEFLHGQYDGGHGAGLEDYWDKMWHNPLSAGGFLWDFADNAIMRKDLHDSLDTDKDRGADGIVGPHHEKEGSFYTIKEVWSPIYFERREIAEGFDGSFNIENRYHYSNTSECSFSWTLKRFELTGTKEKSGTAVAPDIQPNAKGRLQIPLPNDWKNYDALYITVKDRNSRVLFTWSFPISRPAETSKRLVQQQGNSTINLTEKDTAYEVAVKNIRLQFSKANGMLVSATNSKGILPLHNGPIVQEGPSNFSQVKQHKEGNNLIIESEFNKKTSFSTLKWTIYPSGWVQLDVQYFPGSLFTNFAGINFSFAEKDIKSVTYMGDGPYRAWKNRLKGNQFGVWNKTYNNTETGESPWIYPEFKGYHSRFYGGRFFTNSGNSFTVTTNTEDLFLRLFTPKWKTDPWHNYEPLFPTGDISFMQGITSIGSKTQGNETTGPMGMKNIMYDYEKDPSRALKITLYFDFSE